MQALRRALGAAPVRLPFLFAGPEAEGGIDTLARELGTRRPAGRMTLPELLDDAPLVLCVGSGGVGKTTTAAALAVAAARRGRRTAVLTVDPAQRLRDALGLGELDGRPRRVPLPGGARGSTPCCST